MPKPTDKTKAVRGDRVVDETPGEGNIVKVKTPAFVTLVGTPANQIGFKVVRKDSTAPRKEPDMTTKTIVRRTRRADASPILALTFPEGTTHDDVTAALESYGMSGYTITESDGLFKAMRSDLKSISRADVLDIRLNEAGVTATIKRNDALAPVSSEPGEKNGVAITSFEFDNTLFDETQVSEWLKRNDVDSSKVQTENSDNSYVVRRMEVPENEETRSLVLEEGVTAVCIRADVYDVPDGFYAVINESAYGSWGWGHLDFAATMADVAFSEQVRDGVSRLDDVLRNILFYSPLPLDVRKTLMANALTQFGAYVEAIMDSLPRQLLVSVVRSAQPHQEKDMSKANNGGANQPAAETKAPEQAQSQTVTREDVASIVAEAIKPLTEQVATIVRGDKPAAAAATTEEAVEEKPITRSDLVTAMAEAVKPLAERMEKLEGTTVVRSDTDDASVQNTQETPEQAAARVEASKKDGTIFRGALGNFGASRRKTA